MIESLISSLAGAPLNQGRLRKSPVSCLNSAEDRAKIIKLNRRYFDGTLRMVSLRIR